MRITPAGRAFRITERTSELLEELACLLDMPRGKILDLALRAFGESGETPAKAGGGGYGRSREYRLSTEALAVIEACKGCPILCLLEAAVVSFGRAVVDLQPMPIHWFTVGSAARLSTLLSR